MSSVKPGPPKGEIKDKHGLELKLFIVLPREPRTKESVEQG